MSKKREPINQYSKRNVSCTWKDRLNTEDEARAKAIKRGQQYSKTFDVYPCKYCNGFHLTTVHR